MPKSMSRLISGTSWQQSAAATTELHSRFYSSPYTSSPTKLQQMRLHNGFSTYGFVSCFFVRRCTFTR